MPLLPAFDYTGGAASLVLKCRPVYPHYPRHWLETAQALWLKEFFYLVCSEISSRLDYNPHVDERGLTDELVRLLTDRQSELVETLQDRMKISRSFVEFTVRETSVRDEATLGADLGLVIRIATDDIQFQRGALFQAKRLQPSGDRFDAFGSYGLDLKRAQLQSDRMLSQSHAAFFVLYNPSVLPAFARVEDREQLDKVTARILAHYINHYAYAQTQLRESMPTYELPSTPPHAGGLPLDPSDKVCVLPAVFVKHARPSALRASPLYRYTTSFANFVVDDLIRGSVGDWSQQGVTAARGESRQFIVRYSLGVDIRSGRFFTGEALQPLFQ